VERVPQASGRACTSLATGQCQALLPLRRECFFEAEVEPVNRLLNREIADSLALISELGLQFAQTRMAFG